ncbi:MAG: NifU N-terminal domain-containing protein [Phycisphaerales bacterium]|jgi:hypothetical protein|nr:NifU N-terminal domain-containing protein [Phycisphaeraceae bacterium]
MPYRVTRYQQTPNPDALKCELDRSTGRHKGPPRSFRSAEQAAGDPLGRAIMQIPGIAGVLIHEDWLTITRAPNTPWESLKPHLERTLGSAT